MHQLDEVIRFANLPIRAQLADRLADVMFDLEEILGLLTGDNAKELRCIVPRLRSAFSEIDAAMKHICD